MRIGVPLHQPRVAERKDGTIAAVEELDSFARREKGLWRDRKQLLLGKHDDMAVLVATEGVIRLRGEQPRAAQEPHISCSEKGAKRPVHVRA